MDLTGDPETDTTATLEVRHRVIKYLIKNDKDFKELSEWRDFWKIRYREFYLKLDKSDYYDLLEHLDQHPELKGVYYRMQEDVINWMVENKYHKNGVPVEVVAHAITHYNKNFFDTLYYFFDDANDRILEAIDKSSTAAGPEPIRYVQRSLYKLLSGYAREITAKVTKRIGFLFNDKTIELFENDSDREFDDAKFLSDSLKVANPHVLIHYYQKRSNRKQLVQEISHPTVLETFLIHNPKVFFKWLTRSEIVIDSFPLGGVRHLIEKNPEISTKEVEAYLDFVDSQ